MKERCEGEQLLGRKRRETRVREGEARDKKQRYKKREEKRLQGIDEAEKTNKVGQRGKITKQK